MNGAVRFFVSWLVLFVILYALAKNKWGHPIIYYTAWLTVVLMIVLNANSISQAFGGTGLGGITGGGGG